MITYIVFQSNYTNSNNFIKMYLQNILNDISELLHFHFWLVFSKYLTTR